MTNPSKDEVFDFLRELDKKGAITYWSPTHYLQDYFNLSYRDAKDFSILWVELKEKEKQLERILTGEKYD